MSFSYKVFKIVKTIPKGSIITYKEVAKLAGNPEAYRAVGRIIKKSPDVKNIPCHRVVRSNLSLSTSNKSETKNQQKLLEKEGLQFKGNKIIIKTD